MSTTKAIKTSVELWKEVFEAMQCLKSDGPVVMSSLSRLEVRRTKSERIFYRKCQLKKTPTQNKISPKHKLKTRKMLLIRDTVPPKGMVPSDEEENRSVALNHDGGAFAGSPTLPLPQFLMLDVKMTNSCDRSAT